MSVVLTDYLKRTVIDGSLKDVTATRLVFRLEKCDIRAMLRNQATFSVTLTDDKGRGLLEVWRGTIGEDCTMTIMDFDEAFKIYTEIT